MIKYSIIDTKVPPTKSGTKLIIRSESFGQILPKTTATTIDIRYQTLRQAKKSLQFLAQRRAPHQKT